MRRAGVGRVALTALVVGVVAAVVEMIFVLPIQALVLHNPPVRVFQFIAMGRLGPAALKGGWTTGLEGVAWHLLVSVVAAAVYAIASLRWVVLLRRPVVSGLAFGVAVYVFMIFGVIPLSAIGFTIPPPTVLTLISFSIHLVGFGLPIALVNRLMLGEAAAG